MRLGISVSGFGLLLILSGCSTHYAVDGHHGSHVSVGVHGHGHGNGALGALIVGGVIGHVLTEAAHDQAERLESSKGGAGATPEVINDEASSLKPEVNPEQSRYYQSGQDGHCYLMEKKDGEVVIVSMVPRFSCE